jgi:hypothetical protein
MMVYPCSYMIYSKAFEALPLAAKRLVYARMRDILTGRALEPRYVRISRSDRQAVIEILQDTTSDLSQYFIQLARGRGLTGPLRAGAIH